LKEIVDADESCFHFNCLLNEEQKEEWAGWR
jgi:hypothetical protein